jgi:hypothetical protein
MNVHVHTASNAELDQLAMDQDNPSGDVVLRRLYNFLGRFIRYPSEATRVAHTLWIAHTHMMDRWSATGRLAFLSAEKESGKTRALEVTEKLVPNPKMTANGSANYLFRIAAQGVTLLYDEIDTIFGPKAQEHEDIRSFLNAGYKRSGYFGRCVTVGNKIETEDLPAYAAVAVAGIGFLPDTILSRSVVVQMRRRRQGERVEPWRERSCTPQADRLRSSLAAWAQSQPQAIDEWPTMPNGIEDRAEEIWEPLIVVADLAGGDWPARAREAAVMLVMEGRDKEISLGVKLLADLRTVFGNSDTKRTAEILADLCAMEEAPWGDIKGKPLDARGLARQLKQYGVKSHVIRFGEGTANGYRRADLLDAWDRYVPPSEQNSITSKTDETANSPRLGDLDSVSDVMDVLPVMYFPEGKERQESHNQKCRHCRGDGLVKMHYCGDKSAWLHPECADAYFEVANGQDQNAWPSVRIF